MRLVFDLDEFAEDNGRGGIEYGNRKFVVVVDDERVAEAKDLFNSLRAEWHSMDNGSVCLGEYLLAGLRAANLLQQQ